jgi:hypothetical protein
MSPRFIPVKLRGALLGVLLVLGSTAPLQAGVITYEEILEDLNDPLVFVDFLQNLQRTRTLGDGSPPEIEGNNRLIRVQNNVSPSFGRWGTDEVTYSHVFHSVGEVDSFLLASLEIRAASVSPTPQEGVPPPDFFELLFGIGIPDDPVVVDGQLIGYLTPGHPLQTTTFQYSTGDTALIELLLENDRINVSITPLGPGPILEGNGDKVSVRSSTLRVTYQTGSAPEPGTGLLFSGGLLAAGLARKRQARLR